MVIRMHRIMTVSLCLMDINISFLLLTIALKSVACHFFGEVRLFVQQEVDLLKNQL